VIFLKKIELIDKNEILSKILISVLVGLVFFQPLDLVVLSLLVLFKVKSQVKLYMLVNGRLILSFI